VYKTLAPRKSSYSISIALTILDPEVIAEIEAESTRTNLTPDEVIRSASTSQREKKSNRWEEIDRYLASEIWPHIPSDLVGKQISKAEEEALLGYEPGEY
jgi:hypothetical protein